MINIKDLTFIYPKALTPALVGVNANIPPGIHLLVGPNGAGKSTMLLAIAGLIAPTSGEILIDGVYSRSMLPSSRQRLFMVDDNIKLTATTIRKFANLHSGFYPNFSEDAFERYLEYFGLSGNEKISKLSLGNRKKSILSYALALGVDFLLLDEPTNGLDIESKDALRMIFAEQSCDRQTIIISTHNVEEFKNLYDGMIAINRGKFLLAATAEDISEILDFSISPSKLPDALYSELCLGGYASICEVSDESYSDIDWTLLYKALTSPGGDKIVSLFSNRR